MMMMMMMMMMLVMVMLTMMVSIRRVRTDGDQDYLEGSIPVLLSHCTLRVDVDVYTRPIQIFYLLHRG